MPTNRVFSAPKEIGQPPDTTEMVYPKWLEAEGKYVAKVVEYAKKKGTGSHRGKQVALPMGDGHALYVILTSSPLQLIHVAIGDAWHSPLINQLTTAAIKKMAFEYDPTAYNLGV